MAPSPRSVVRVFRTHASGEELRAVEPLLMAHVDRFAPVWRQVFAHWVGVSGRDDAELVTVTGWESGDELRRATAGDGGRAAREGPMGELVRRGTSVDYDLVDQLASSFEPAAAAILRLVRLPVRPQCEAELLDLVRPVREDWAAAGDLAVTQVLRRDDPEGPTILVVAAWRDAAALARRRGSPDAAVTPERLLRAPATADTFDLLPVSALRLSPLGPAILIADDAGVVVDATPAAASLLRRDIWGILGEQLEAIVPPADGAPVPVPRPEGGVVLVHALEARNVPAPGRHALVLLPATGSAPTERDALQAVRRAYRWNGAVA